ncbi:MAG TPA: DUF5686 family protein, partial [Chitinophagaceae bacterium]|nr:DUF5686 family protein [Chitinophagaceae bacterium]
MYRNLLLIVFSFTGFSALAQPVKIYGKVTNARMEPLAFANVQVKEYQHGSITKEDGSYTLELEEGKYDLVVSMVGYKPQVITIILAKKDYEQNIIMEASDATNLSEVTVKGKFKDKAEDYIRNVIRNKDAIENAAGAYSCNVYIKAVQEDSMAYKKPKKAAWNDSMMKAQQANAELNRMSLAEIVLRLDRESSRKIKEERLGITKKGNPQSLFYLSTTEGDINFYNNLVSIPSVAQTPFLSPLSYSGLVAYRFKTLRTETINGRKIYTIGIKPRQLSNATVEGEITVMDSAWVVLHTKLILPKYHLAAYDFFEIEQEYEQVNLKTWMITRQQFTYSAGSDKRKASGRTIVTYRDFELNKIFDKKYFGTEISTAAQKAYEQDSSFWQANRTEPLTEKEVRFIHFKDSVFRATHAKAYLDSVDKVTNTITWQNLLFKGQNFNDHEKQRSWYIPAIPSIYAL